MTDTLSPALSAEELADIIDNRSHKAHGRLTDAITLWLSEAEQIAAALRELADTRKALEEADAVIAGHICWEDSDGRQQGVNTQHEDDAINRHAGRHTQTEQKP